MVPSSRVTPAHRFPPPEKCALLAELAARCGGSLEIKSAASQVDYALPSHAAAELVDFLQPYASLRFGPRSVAVLPGGRVVGPGIVLAPDGRTLARDVSVDFGKGPDEHWLLASSNIKPAQSIAGPTAVIASALGSGYSHWLLDELPRLLTLGGVGFGTLIAHAAPPFSRAALQLHGYAGALVEPGRYTHFQCETLFVPSLVGEVGHPTPETTRLLTEFATPLFQTTAPFGERLYLTRANARRRRIANEAALWSTLEAAGFVQLALETLTWPEQINAFRHAKVVVAPHGAGLANLVFCPPGTKVVELFNRSYVHWTYWQLAALQGLDYRPIVAPGGEPLSHTMASNRLDIVADLAQVRASLR